jgi:hypothetical protein
MNIKEKKKEYAVLFGYRCYVCRKPFGSGFVYHHLYYDGGEPSYKDRYRYFDYVFKQIETNPRQFLLLCKNHHYFVEWGKRIADDKFKRFIKARNKSLKAGGKEIKP